MKRLSSLAHIAITPACSEAQALVRHLQSRIQSLRFFRCSAAFQSVLKLLRDVASCYKRVLYLTYSLDTVIQSLWGECHSMCNGLQAAEG